MALFGHLNVTLTNGGTQVIGFWQARRTVPIESPDQVSLYECTMRFNSHVEHTFDVEHRYSDGAVVLLQKVLERYTELTT
jgi:hypothetical protein